MPSVELSKLQGIAAPRAVTSGERAQIGARSASTRAADTPASGVSVAVGTAVEAASPPVDAERVAQIRAALQDGSYPLVPTRIVDAMIAAQVSFAVPVKD
ncbi:flagellar biosynthesis anti-sigma factor FlgM [Erythrobacter dokdonensis]|uniref:Anti-sigma-28 factor, FlgM family protein n=1 Tax=Erythrobacter dokdonensis DSW-74 TaxID=1300349 RepID=A0A1A7BHL7_9SPHN|nr:flagellar biosynthesis anti-sigma factor FlgM [Erythrobacter dokdonensis]OBV10927.1 Anti-sigma-28 factor, FlgM family protein [Erythrobacter dokdonensis DSW-74]